MVKIYERWFNLVTLLRDESITFRRESYSRITRHSVVVLLAYSFGGALDVRSIRLAKRVSFSDNEAVSDATLKLQMTGWSYCAIKVLKFPP